MAFTDYNSYLQEINSNTAYHYLSAPIYTETVKLICDKCDAKGWHQRISIESYTKSVIIEFFGAETIGEEANYFSAQIVISTKYDMRIVFRQLRTYELCESIDVSNFDFRLANKIRRQGKASDIGYYKDIKKIPMKMFDKLGAVKNTEYNDNCRVWVGYAAVDLFNSNISKIFDLISKKVEKFETKNLEFISKRKKAAARINIIQDNVEYVAGNITSILQKINPSLHTNVVRNSKNDLEKRWSISIANTMEYNPDLSSTSDYYNSVKIIPEKDENLFVPEFYSVIKELSSSYPSTRVAMRFLIECDENGVWSVKYNHFNSLRHIMKIHDDTVIRGDIDTIDAYCSAIIDAENMCGMAFAVAKRKSEDNSIRNTIIDMIKDARRQTNEMQSIS